MEDKTTTTIPPSEQELEEFRRFKADKERKDRLKAERETYKQIVDEEVDSAIPILLSLSEGIKETKKTLFENFKSAIDMKTEILQVTKDDQRSHTFTNSKGDKRITLGVYVTDGYRDTAEEGIAIIKEYLESLAVDPQSSMMVKMILKLLARDAAGTLKASRVLQLRKLAEELGDGRFMEGVRIIEDAYQPATSKRFARAEMKGENGEWMNIPLGMTEA
ncbi:hypothetical protein EZS27_012347 [termite gut metagenome]|uniref:DUF3164 family protein n=1 Tax=termite gut metagenome TaxID=433724 RepID=A0A5J4S0X9_9ZZZZ